LTSFFELVKGEETQIKIVERLLFIIFGILNLRKMSKRYLLKFGKVWMIIITDTMFFYRIGMVKLDKLYSDMWRRTTASDISMSGQWISGNNFDRKMN
jgi:hypothetical protein